MYLATTLDLYSRRIAGWSMRERMTSDLVIDALRMAILQRNRQSGLVHHSDRGSQYARGAFQQVLTAHGIACSMSRVGVSRIRYAARNETRQAIIEWIEVFHNRQRRHSTLGCRSPTDHEAAA